ncbi:prepilin peptidase [Edaphobacter modestus]|uniref:Type 4 prepilin peptidase 1 n=1 Tax=Edaphobacter modestus TaxID=388466 RepID=A0A4V2G483_9BACT|nr:A24 family peptidase [Edaphobacter modestus]RZU39866.1 type 4 prepilin peptidase 1 [Edaphobacter modestus]
MTSRIPYEAAGFLLGLLFGSFLNVCISRLPRRGSVVQPASHCPRCKASIHWYDNIPILSWLVLRGRCRDCGQPIPWRYPLVELATAFWFAIQAARLHTVLSFYFHDPTHSAPSSYAPFAIIANLSVTILGFLLIGLMVMDWQSGLLPNSFTITGIFIGLTLICAQAIFLGPAEGQVVLPPHSIQLTSVGAATETGNVFLTGPEALVGGRIFAVLGAGLLILIIRWLYRALRHREGMGLGDAKMLAMIAALLGFWPAMVSFFFGALAASVYGIYLVARGRANASSRIPFGSFLAAGGLLAAEVGDRIIDAYSQLLR